MRLLACALFLLAACTPTMPAGRGGDDDDSPPPSGDTCSSDGATRCSGQAYQTCTGGTWQTSDTCASDEACYPAFGCAQCDPTLVRVCMGNDVYSCENGQLGGVVEQCGAQGCSGGSCGGSQNSDCDESTQVIYVVDKNNDFLSFDPRNNANTFHKIGTLNCPAGPAYPSVDPLGGAATPFSMSIDRMGRAWVLYSSGEIFLVNTQDASCQPSGFHAGQQGFELFGMSFVSDTAGSNAETLYISGGAAGNVGSGQSDLGSVDASLAVHKIGAIPAMTNQQSPELTGNGNGELWAYFPGGGLFGGGPSSVARLDRNTGAHIKDYAMPTESGLVDAWAFAHYGGRYYVFVEAASARVLRLDPMGNGGAGQVDVVVPDSGHSIVGAGVSTCAPVVVN